MSIRSQSFTKFRNKPDAFEHTVPMRCLGALTRKPPLNPRPVLEKCDEPNCEALVRKTKLRRRCKPCNDKVRTLNHATWARTHSQKEYHKERVTKREQTQKKIQETI